MTRHHQLPRRSFLRIGLTGTCCAAVVPWTTGCQPPPDGLVEQARREVLIADYPDQVSSLAQVYASEALPDEVVVSGRIFANLDSPFDPQNASFSIIELPKPGHDHDNPGDCPFCKREMENAAMAVVQLVDEQGQLVAKSAEQLLGLTKNQDIVVVGTPSKLGDVLVISARSIHVLSSEDALKLAKQTHA